MAEGGMVAPVLERETAMARPAATPAATPALASPGEGSRVQAVIYEPCRSAMSSGGKAARASWVLEFERRSPSLPDPLMGWSSSADTLAQIRLKFPSREAAVAYARRNGIAATVIEPHRPQQIIRSYASNFIGIGVVRVSGPVSQRHDG